MSITKLSGERPSRRLGWITLAVLAVALAAGVLLGLLLFSPSRFLPLVEQAMVESTGLPSSVEDLSIQWGASPRAVLSGVKLGDDAFGASMDRIEADLSLGAIWRGQVTATRVTLVGAQLRLPESTGQTGRQFGDVVATGRAEGDSSGGGFEVAEVVAKDLQVSREGAAWATAQLNITGVTAPELHATMDLRTVAGDASATVDATYTKADQKMRGSFAVQGPIRALFPELGEQDLTLNLSAVMDGSFKEQVTAKVEGGFASARYQQKGTLAALVFWKDGLIIANDLEAVSEDCEIRMDTTITPGEEVAFEIFRAVVGPQTLALWSAALSPESVKLDLAADAGLNAAEVLGAWPLGEGTSPRFERGEISFHGVSAAPAAAAKTWPPLRGMKGSLRVGQNRVLIDSLEADGVTLAGAATVPAPGEPVTVELNGRVQLAALDFKGIAALSAINAAEGIIAIDALRYTPAETEGGAPEISFSGSADKVGFTAQLPGADKPVSAKGISGGIGFDGKQFTLDALKADGLALNGSIGLPKDGEAVPFKLSGDVNLAHPLIQLATASAPITGLSGALKLNKLEGSLDAATRAPVGLVVEGSVKGGGFSAPLGSAMIKATDLAGDFATTEGVVEAKLSLQSAELGAVKWDGALDTRTQDLSGNLTLNLAQAASALAPALRDNEMARQVVAAYGEADLRVTAALPKGDRAPSLMFESVGAPPIKGSVGFLRAKDGTVSLGEVQLDTTIALDGVQVPGPAPVVASGKAPLRFQRPADGTDYTATINFDAADLRVGDYLHKQPGQSMQVALSGSGKTWQPGQLRVEILGQPLALGWKDGALGADALQLDLASLAPLFPPNVETRGRVEGRFRMTPLDVDLKLSGVALALSESLRADSINGRMAYTDGAWEFTQLQVQAADSDLLLDVGLREGRWGGRISGRRLNLNTAMAMQQSYAGGGDAGGEADSSGSSGGGVSGKIDLALDEVLYRNATLTSVQGTLGIAPDRIELIGLRANAGAGLVEGDILYLPAKGGGAASAAVQLNTTAADAAVIDGLLFEQPRGLKGAVDSRLNLRFPIAKDTPPYMGLDGTMEFVATKGTYGQAGFATKILSVLRTTEILRLSLPGFGDSGLVFDTSSASFEAKQGVVDLKNFNLIAKSYAFEAQGMVDFPQMATNIEGRMSILESVTGIVSAVPILGGTVDRLKSKAGVAFVITGSPFDVKVSVKPGTNPVRDTREGIRDAVKDVKAIGNLLGL